MRSSKPIALKAKRKCQRHPKGLTYLVWLVFKGLQFLLFVSDINFIEETIRFWQWNVCYVTSFSFQITQGLSFSCWSTLFTLVTHLLKGKQMNNVNQAQAWGAMRGYARSERGRSKMLCAVLREAREGQARPRCADAKSKKPTQSCSSTSQAQHRLIRINFVVVVLKFLTQTLLSLTGIKWWKQLKSSAGPW